MVTYGEMLAGPPKSQAQSVSLDLTSCNCCSKVSGPGRGEGDSKGSNEEPSACGRDCQGDHQGVCESESGFEKLNFDFAKVSEEDKRRQRAREKELEEAGNLFDNNNKEEEGEVGGQMGRSEARGKRRKEPAGGRRRDGEHDAQKIYREILEV